MSDRHHISGGSKSGDTQVLTGSELDLLDTFRSSADDARVDILAMVQSVAKGNPKQTARPALFVASINGKAHMQRKGACNAKS